MKAAFHQQLALGLVDQFHGLGGSSFAMGRVDDLEAADVDAVLGAASFIFARARPDRGDEAGRGGLGTPRSELSSQGCTTSVAAGGIAWPRRSGDRISSELLLRHFADYSFIAVFPR